MKRDTHHCFTEGSFLMTAECALSLRDFSRAASTRAPSVFVRTNAMMTGGGRSPFPSPSKTDIVIREFREERLGHARGRHVLLKNTSINAPGVRPSEREALTPPRFTEEQPDMSILMCFDVGVLPPRRAFVAKHRSWRSVAEQRILPTKGTIIY